MFRAILLETKRYGRVKALIALVLGSLLLSACKPIQFYMLNVEGPPEYVQGFEDGCDSGVSSGGSLLQRWFNPYKKDPEKLENALYKMGWNEGFSYCRFTVPTAKF